MKAPRQLTASIAVVFIALFAFEAMGQTPNSIIPPSGLPVWLPTKNQASIIEYDVTNCTSSMNLRVWYTNISGVSEYTGIIGNYKWASYDNWKQFVVSNANYCFLHSHSPIATSSMIRLFVNIGYDNGGSVGFVPAVFQISTNIGYASNISLNSFVGAMANPVTTNAYVIMPITGLSGFHVQVGTNYSYTWPAVSGIRQQVSGGVYPPELTTSGVLCLNQWYIGNPSTRFSLTIGNNTQWYTGYGDWLGSAGTVSITQNARSVTISVTVPHGANVTFQDSTDLVNWSDGATFMGSLNTGMISFTVDKSDSYRFFKPVIQ